MRSIMWFRNDLRLDDNQALIEAAKGEILPIFIIDPDINIGSASKSWLHFALLSLSKEIENHINFYIGNPKDVIEKLVEKFNITNIYWNRVYEPKYISRDAKIKEFFKLKGLQVESFNSSLLFEPAKIVKDDGTPYRVFTPFYKNGCLKSGNSPKEPVDAPVNLKFINDAESRDLDSLNLLPSNDWYKKVIQNWDVSCSGAYKLLNKFFDQGIQSYKEGRNLPASNNNSRLSPYIHFGQISINRIWYMLDSLEPSLDLDHFKMEIGWREFSYNLLYHNPELDKKNYQSKFDNFPWVENQELLEKWQKGITGYPMVDAGMRELWQTGFMHNRVRMVVASFLTKNLQIDWRRGLEWFDDCLFDADLANNSASWQWVAGSGADAAPYFRIFNPFIQAERFDPKNEYIRKFVPEFEIAGKYPSPIIDFKLSRNKALEIYRNLVG